MSGTVKYKNALIHYTSTGSGPPLILLHGFLESREIWTETVSRFSPHAMIVTIDLPGHGQSESFSDVHTMKEMAEAVRVVLQELNITKSSFIGHSMGGYVTLAFLAQYPEAVKDLLLLNSTPEADSEEKRIQRDRAVHLVKKNKKAYIRMAISNLVPPSSQGRFEKELDLLKEKAYKFSTEGIVAALQGMKIRPDRSESLYSFEGLKVIVTGEEDPLLDKEHMSRVAAETNCVFFVLPGGHLSYLESKTKFWKLCISSKK